jgi:uncharacterized protein
MFRWFHAALLSLFVAHVPAAMAQIQTGGALVIVAAQGEVKHANDEVIAVLMVEEQDKDKAAAASRVNLKMKQGVDLVKKEDPTAILKTRGYYTYPVYADEIQPRPPGRARQLNGWRVGQYLEVKTSNLEALPRTIATAQRILALNGLNFGLADKTMKMLEEQRIAAAYGNLMDRIAAVARAMGRTPAEAVLDTVDFEASGNYAPMEAQAGKAMRANAAPAMDVEEPSFEPGETTLVSRVVGKVRFK